MAILTGKSPVYLVIFDVGNKLVKYVDLKFFVF